MSNGLPDPAMSRWSEDWNAVVALAKSADGEWVLGLEDRKISLATSVRARTTPPFVDSTGRLRVAVRNSKMNKGRRCGDLWVRWEPSAESEDEDGAA